MTAITSRTSPTEAIKVELPPAPYPGLRPFEASEWPIFFGRERIVADLLQRLTRQRLVMVHGGSGCGKSSVIRAGLLPRLVLDQRRNDGAAWRTAIMRPGGSPLWHLSQAIAAVTDSPADEQSRNEQALAIRRALNLGLEALPELAARFGLGRNAPVCLLLDQFEELFTYAREGVREEALTFIDVLRGFAAETQPLGVHAVITMRSDHLGDCGRYLGFAELVNRSQYLVPRMNDADLLRAIREPARLYDGEVTLDLAMRLIQDSAAEADALPLVQHCLMRMWQKAPVVDFPPVSIADAPTPPWIGQYTGAEAPAPTGDVNGLTGAPSRPSKGELSEASGSFEWPAFRRVSLLFLPMYSGLHASLSTHADEVLTTVPAKDQRLVELVFRSLIDMSPQGRILRRPRTLKELLVETRADPVSLDRALRPFRRASAAFLTPVGDTDLHGDDVIDLGHEALARCWSQVSSSSLDSNGEPIGWIQREREAKRFWLTIDTYADRLRTEDLLPSDVYQHYIHWINHSHDEIYYANRYGGNLGQVTYAVALSRYALIKADTILHAKLLFAIFAVLSATAFCFIFYLAATRSDTIERYISFDDSVLVALISGGVALTIYSFISSILKISTEKEKIIVIVLYLLALILLSCMFLSLTLGFMTWHAILVK